MFIWTCVLLWTVTGIELFESTVTKALIMVTRKEKLLTLSLIFVSVMFKWQICYTEMTHLLQFTINIHKSHRQPHCSSQLVCEDRVLFVWVDLHLSLRWQQRPKCEPAIRLLYPPSFCKLRCPSSPHTQNSNGFKRQIHTALSRQSFTIRYMFIWTFFLTVTDTVSFQNIDPSSWITLYI